ncbi:hypothetical protein B0H66DRAFT_296339 [Apodospora peruviana]|uniref:Uncharacterized protein n=1 Tax=Apodospora peruviana TaxID=516989 RepID=A0AAE0I1D4_9PEZI|nr:hypothetical protein B0H66DRAFT_296339 [Apodospora peruviana]
MAAATAAASELCLSGGAVTWDERFIWRIYSEALLLGGGATGAVGMDYWVGSTTNATTTKPSSITETTATIVPVVDISSFNYLQSTLFHETGVRRSGLVVAWAHIAWLLLYVGAMFKAWLVEDLWPKTWRWMKLAARVPCVFLVECWYNLYLGAVCPEERWTTTKWGGSGGANIGGQAGGEAMSGHGGGGVGKKIHHGHGPGYGVGRHHPHHNHHPPVKRQVWKLVKSKAGDLVFTWTALAALARYLVTSFKWVLTPDMDDLGLGGSVSPGMMTDDEEESVSDGADNASEMNDGNKMPQLQQQQQQAQPKKADTVGGQRRKSGGAGKGKKRRKR